MTTDKISIRVENLTKLFGKYTALDAINGSFEPGKLVALLGPSGSGKTTLLRMIAGLDFADSGRILFNEQDVTTLSPRERQVGLVFQHYALFRHMTVFDNVAFGQSVKPRKERLPAKVIRDKVNELLELVQLGEHGHRYPSQLSGGQKQRVALARTLAVDPRILLLDEPFGALDAKVRKDLRRWLREFHEKMKITTIFVTHDQEEALELADEIVVMNHAKIEQIGTPQEIYDSPANPFVYEFVGNVNLFRGRVNSGKILIDGKEFSLVKSDHMGVEDVGVAYVRPHDVKIHLEKPSDGALEATVVSTIFSGANTRVHLRRKDIGEMVDAEVPRADYGSLNLIKGQDVFITIRNVQVFTEDYSI